MTDTFLLDDEPHALVVPAAAAIPPATITAAEWEALKGRVTAVEGLGLVDLTDVDATGLADGLTLVYDSTLFDGAGGWKPGSIQGAVSRITNAGTADDARDVTWLSLRNGVEFVESAPGVVFVQLTYGGTGAANLPARWDHTHAMPPDWPLDIAASGDLSSGTRTLVSGAVGLAADREYLLTARLVFDARGSGAGAGFATARIVLNGNTSARPEARVVSGVDREVTWEHAGVTVSGVSSVTVSATFQHNGASDPIYVGAGRLTVTRRPVR